MSVFFGYDLYLLQRRYWNNIQTGNNTVPWLEQQHATASKGNSEVMCVRVYIYGRAKWLLFQSPHFLWTMDCGQ